MTDKELYELAMGGYNTVNKDYIAEQIKKATENLNGLFYVNRICPNCGSYNMRGLSPEMSSKFSYVCLNCSKYFTEDDVYIGKHERRSK